MISGTEELAHLEMVGTIVHQLTRNASIEEVKAGGLDPYYTDHGLGVYPQAAAGYPFTAAVLAVKGDPIADLQEDLAADGAATIVQHFISSNVFQCLSSLL